MSTRGDGKKAKLTVTLLEETASEGHRFGVNALASTSSTLWGGGEQLISGGRDGTIRCWKLPQQGVAATPMLTLSDHTDWVNDLVLINEGEQTSAFVSASSDCTIKLWRPESGGSRPRSTTLRQHTDFVKALAYASQARVLASAGCDASIVLWDLNRAPVGAPLGSDGSDGGPCHSDSIYALATNSSGSVIVSGSVDSEIRVWDPRTAEHHCQLRGHADVVRAVAVNEEGTRVLSCSSDRTVRVWSVGQRRCEAVFQPHDDSVYCCLPLENWRCVLSGARDGSVVQTWLDGSGAVGVCQADAAVSRLHVPSSPSRAPDRQAPDRLWVATTNSSLTCWPLPMATDAHGKAAAEAKPIARVAGSAAVRRFAVLPNKLHVLTEDTACETALWDVTRGVALRRWAKPNGAKRGKYDELHKELTRQQLAVPSWFSASARSGSLEITLDAQTSFNAEAYASDLGIECEEEVRLNLGERFLHAIFKDWAAAQPPQPAQEPDATPSLDFRPLNQVPVCLIEEGVVLAKCDAASLTRAKPEQLPFWITQSVLHGHFTPKESLKLSFFLAPHPDDNLPPLPPNASKLSAAKVLKLVKVLAYVEERLQMNGKGTPLQLVCNDKALPPEMTLATVRAFVWKTGEEMLLHYRRSRAQS
uniref:WD repeat-containing protein 48 homolog n=1 Tax=Chrysotila carterae TaxID=13221 RepID=A0A7S4ESR5_CHRCT|mmetsp:Transcript_28168/g.61679  ORF Transcript_28168/g.61679 Transcript_28168/m.61679 type:complete len:645 (-) Transcript_28168:943-2877(-)